MYTIPLRFEKDLKFTEDEFFEFCRQNPELKLERDENGQILISMPTGSKIGNKNAKLLVKIGIWAENAQMGEVFDSSTGFTLPDNSVRSPDVSWVAKERWEKLSESQKEKFAPLCPDFVIELLSESDSIEELKRKMNKYIENGCRLAWLINTDKEEVYIYRSNGEIQIIKGFQNKLSGEDVLSGFEFDLELLL